MIAACGTATDAAPTAPPRGAAAPVLSASPARLAADRVSLVVPFSESGLRPDRSVTLVATATANAAFHCLNAAGAPIGPELPLVTSASGLQRLRAAGDGTLSGTLTISPPSAAQAPCEDGRRAQLVRVDYSAVSLSDVTNAVRVAVAYA